MGGLHAYPEAEEAHDPSDPLVEEERYSRRESSTSN